MATEADIAFWNNTFGTDYATAQSFGRGPENVDEDINILRSLERSMNAMSEEQKARLGDDPSRRLRNYIYEIKGKLMRDIRATERGAALSREEADRVASNALREVGKIWASPAARQRFDASANWMDQIGRMGGTTVRLEETDLGDDASLVESVMTPPLELPPDMYTDGLTHSPSWYDTGVGVGGEPTRTMTGPSPGIFGDKTPAGVVPMDQGWRDQEDAFSVLDRASPAVRQDAARADRIARERTRNIVPEAAIRSRTVNDLLPEGIGADEALDEVESALGVEQALTPAFDAMTPRQMAGLEEWSLPSVPGLTPTPGPFEGIPGRQLSLDPRITATDTAVVSTPAGTEEVTASVSEPALPDPASAVDQLASLTPRDYAGPRAPSTQPSPVPGAAPAQPEGGGMSPMSLGATLVGGAGIAAAIGNTIADFRTTAALEDQLAASAAGDTIARREGALAGSRAQRNIMATSLGRRDISPALALRNAQMAGSRTLSDVYGQAAIASARERRESEAQLAQLQAEMEHALRWAHSCGGRRGSVARYAGCGRRDGEHEQAADGLGSSEPQPSRTGPGTEKAIRHALST